METTENNFELNEKAYFTPILIEEIEGFDQDDYGNTWFNVVFEGNAETCMWLAKNKPELEKKYYGHLEKTKSGKKLRFKTDLVPKDSTPAYKDNSDAITASMCVKLAFSQFCHVETMLPSEDKHWSQIEYMADMLYKTIKKTGKYEPKKEEE